MSKGSKMDDTKKRGRVGGAKAEGRDRVLYSTTEGRQRFPDLLQTIYGEKAIIGFDRYGRALGAVVPIEAVRMLAGFSDVDDDIRRRIEKTAKSLLSELSGHAGSSPPQEEIVEREDIEGERRAKHAVRKAPAHRTRTG